MSSTPGRHSADMMIISRKLLKLQVPSKMYEYVFLTRRHEEQGGQFLIH